MPCLCILKNQFGIACFFIYLLLYKLSEVGNVVQNGLCSTNSIQFVLILLLVLSLSTLKIKMTKALLFSYLICIMMMDGEFSQGCRYMATLNPHLVLVLWNLWCLTSVQSLCLHAMGPFTFLLCTAVLCNALYFYVCI
jgi:hypothetical protein